MAEVILENFSFEPQELHVRPGEEVVFRNEDDVNHTVTADDASFDSGAMAPNDTYTYTFDSPGDCSYHCEYHPNMTGRIVIE
jgi:plastocyanin